MDVWMHKDGGSIGGGGTMTSFRKLFHPSGGGFDSSTSWSPSKQVAFDLTSP